MSNVQVKVDGTDSDAFALAWDSSVTSVQPDGELKVTVQPKDNLVVKEYRAQISVSADNCTTVSKDLQFEVRKHKFTNYVSNNDATCTEDGTKTATCDFGCGSTDTLSDEGSRLEHRPSDWIIDRDATAMVDGKKHKECTVCGTILESESIPATGTPAGAITDDSKTLNKGIKGTWSGSNIRLSWGKVSGATGYEVYGARCGYKYTKVATVKGTTTSYNMKKLSGKKTSTRYSYKAYVKAYRMVNGKKQLLPTKHVPRVRCFSTNTKVATVTTSGTITAKGKGTCTVYVVGANGVKTTVKVTVK